MPAGASDFPGLGALFSEVTASHLGAPRGPLVAFSPRPPSRCFILPASLPGAKERNILQDTSPLPPSRSLDRAFGQRPSPLFILFIYLLVLETPGDGSGARPQSGSGGRPRPRGAGRCGAGGAGGGAGGGLRAAAEPGLVRAAGAGPLLAGAQPARPRSDGGAAGPGAAPGSRVRGAANGDGYFGTSQPTAG